MPGKTFKFIAQTIDKEVVDSRLGRAHRQAKVVNETPRLDFFPESKKHLHISAKQGQALHPCASLNPEYVCCNTWVLRSISNCPYRCSYCFLQSYLNNGATTVVADIKSLMDEVRIKTSHEPSKFFRIGTWELADSLALEGELGTASELIEAFGDTQNALLELRTKSDCVDPVLALDHKGRTIISWSWNPPDVIKMEEHGTAALDRRLEAMKKILDAGYLTAIHFDPMIRYRGWEQGYEQLVKRIFEVVSAKKVTWISMGALRFNPEMKKTIEDNFPKSKITSAEMVLGGDGKVRYVKPNRVTMLSHLYRAIRKYCGDDPFVYLCMERWDVWEKVLGYAPKSIGHLDYLITKSLFERFPGLVHKSPILKDFEPDAD